MDTPDLDEPTFQMLAGVNRSARYHNRRRMFYENWNSITSAVSAVMLATGSILQSEQSMGWSIVLGVAAAWCAVDAALATSKKAGVHSELASQFVLLEKRFASGDSLTTAEVKSVKERIGWK